MFNPLERSMSFKYARQKALGDENMTTGELQKELNCFKIDAALQYSFDFMVNGNEEIRNLMKTAQEQVDSDDEEWDSKFDLPKPNELAKFSEDIYDSSKKEMDPTSPWRLLYCACGKKVLKGCFDGFYGELHFNIENHYLLLVVKGTSTWGNTWSDIKNVSFGFKGGEINSAFTFGEKVRELLNQFKRKPMLLITGHSLGGYLAQIITYSIIYSYLDQDGKVRSREKPTDDFGIYTVVFDSPAAFKQICSLDQHDPVDFTRFELPVVNFVKDVNIVNSNSLIGPHLGQVFAIDDFKQLDEPGWWKKLTRARSTHGIKNFTNSDLNKIVKIQHLPSKKTQQCSSREIPSFIFTRENLERLYKISFLSSMGPELKDKLPNFRISNSCIYLQDDNVFAEEFIPRAHRFLSHFKYHLDNGQFGGKQLIDPTVYNMWRAEMLEDAHEFRLNEDLRQRVEDLKDGTKIGGFQSYKEMRFVGCLMHNSIEKTFHYDYNKFKSIDPTALDNFATASTVTLILIVKDDHQNVIHSIKKNAKIIYLVIDANAAEKMTLDHDALDERSRNLLHETELDFLGNKVRAVDVFGSRLMQKLPVWNILDFRMASLETEVIFYSNQGICAKNLPIGGFSHLGPGDFDPCGPYPLHVKGGVVRGASGPPTTLKSPEAWGIVPPVPLVDLPLNLPKRFRSATEFANELKKGELKFVLISSNAGMGKSTTLKQIARTLRKNLPHFWIVHLNLYECQREFRAAKDQLNSKEDALKFVRNLALRNCDRELIAKKVFNWKVEDKKVIFLLDSLDEICPIHRDTAETLIEQLRKTELQIVVTTRPHEGRRFTCAALFELQLFDTKNDIDMFLKRRFECLKIELSAETLVWFDSVITLQDIKIWCIPMSLVMIMSYVINDTKGTRNVRNTKGKIDFYKDFINKSIADTLDVKIGIDKNKATSADDYEEKVENYNKFIEILAISAIFHGGEVPEKFQELIAANGKFINRFVVAKLDGDYKFVSFLHNSYAEYLVAKVFVEQLIFVKPHQLGKNQLKIILIKEEFQAIRSHICKILAGNTASVENTICLSDAIKGNESSVLKVLISEDCYELYMLLKNVLCFAHENFVIKHGGINIFYLALKCARREFVDNLIQDGAKFENILHKENLLHMALRLGFNEQVKIHFETLKSSINVYSKSCNSPLFYATLNGNVEMVKLLIENGALVNKVHKRGTLFTCLYYTIREKNIEIMNVLLEKRTGLMIALVFFLEFEQFELFATFCSKVSTNIKQESLQMALGQEISAWCRLEQCKRLCELGANPSAFDADGQTSVHYAVKQGQLECVQYFLSISETINLRNGLGETLLMTALEENHADIIEWLLEQNADVNIRDMNGFSCLHLAAQIGNIQYLDLLIDEGIDQADNDGDTALHYAATNGHADVIKCLLDRSANPHLRTNLGSTCLHLACESNSLECVEQLVEHLPINCRDKELHTPLHWTSLHGDLETAAFLLERGADPNATNAEGRTSLHFSIKRGQLQIAKTLVEKGADINAQDKYGETPLALAERYENLREIFAK